MESSGSSKGGVEVLILDVDEGLLPFQVENISGAVARMAREVGLSPEQIDIAIVSENEIARLNFRFRNKDTATDVLSFPSEGGGSIALCPAVILKRSEEWERPYREQFAATLAHAIAHLAGYDHQTEEEAEKMAEIEKRLLHAARNSIGKVSEGLLSSL